MFHITTAWCMLKLRMEERPPIWRVVSNITKKPSRTADEGWSSSLCLGEGLTNFYRKKWLCVKMNKVPWARTDPLVQPKQWQRDMRLGTWNGGSL